MRIILLLVAAAVFASPVFAQYSVKLVIDKGDQEVRNSITTLVTQKIETLKDVKLASKANYEIRISAIKQAADKTTSSYFISIISVANTTCVIERDSNGSVTSSAECQEFITSNIAVGPKDDLERIINIFISSFDASILEPLRELAKEKQ